MSTIATSNFAGTAGSAWPTLSNGASWSFATEGNAFVSAPSRTVDGSNHGNTTATPNATAANKSIERAQVGTNAASDPLVTVVIRNNNATANYGWLSQAVSGGIMLRRVSAAATYYMVTSGRAAGSGKSFVYGLQIGKVSPAGTYTVLKSVSGTATSMDDLATTTNRYVLQAKITTTASGILVAARAWTGTATGSPTVGWSSNAANVYSSVSSYSCAYEDTSPLSGNLNGLWVWRGGSGASSTVEFSDFSYADQAPLVVDPAGGIVTGETVPGTAVLVRALVPALLRVGGLASGEAWGGPMRFDQIVGKRPGGIVSGETWGGPGRFDQSTRIGSIATGEAFGGALLAQVVKNLGGLASAATVPGIASILNQGVQRIRAGSVSSAEAFGGFTIYKVGGTVYATHTLTGLVVASGATVTEVVSSVNTLTGGAVSSTHLLQP